MAVMQIEFKSNSLQRNVSALCIIPDGLVAGEKLPAMHLLHGYYGCCKDWLNQTRIERLATKYGVAVFCISGENSFYVDDKESRRLYAQLTGEEFVEFTRRMFPISNKREETVIAGLSMGGYGAIRNGLYYNDTFSGIYAFSSAFITDLFYRFKPDDIDPLGNNQEFYERFLGEREKVPGGKNDPRALAEICVKKHGKLPQIYMACGTQDSLLDINREYRDYFSAMSDSFVYEEWQGGHDWDFWDAAIEKALELWRN